jgi:squalene-hopene/tetraprenyl-beta-curcumene cyclase
MVDPERLLTAYETARNDLLLERVPEGHWIGELASSALSTATAVSALAIVQRHLPTNAAGRFANESEEQSLCELIMAGLQWLADAQNPDGGWGDTDKSISNIATTMLVRAAFHLTGVPADHSDLLERADQYVKAHGGIAGLRRRYGKDKTFAVPILTNCALAGLVPWREVSPLPFELACLPQSWYRFLRLPVVSYAIPALVAIGQARYFHKKPLNPLVRWWRGAAAEKSLYVLEQMQPASGGFLEATPLTSFVVMSLASIGQVRHPVTRRGVDFLLRSARPDGSWPIDSNLATWNTTLALNALAGSGEEIAELDCLDWLLNCQNREPHPYTGAAPGGWGWSDLSGAVPDADDTPGALLALSAIAADLPENDPIAAKTWQQIESSARAGIEWLLGLQNSDGGWPTFCRGWGTLPFDRSGSDLTAHVLRALCVWRDRIVAYCETHAGALPPAEKNLGQRLDQAVMVGLAYLARVQRTDGSWVPLWFGNQYRLGDENPVYGTAKVLFAYRDLHRIDSPVAQRGVAWLTAQQNPDGGWGGGPIPTKGAVVGHRSSVEETALAVEALLAAESAAAIGDASRTALRRGLIWLVEAVESRRHQESSPIGFYFAKLWYYERLYPLTFTVSALGQALHRALPQSESKADPAHLKNPAHQKK